jgi:very-short-patch-repair endonuclease
VADEDCIEHPMGAKCSPRGIDELISKLATRQHGVVGRQQLLARGVGRRAVGARVAGSRLHPVHHGVYAVGHPLLTLRGRWMAAVLAAGKGALLSHRSAAALWGLAPPRGGAAIDVTGPRAARHRKGMVRHRSQIPDDERELLDGIPVTSVTRTILDLAAVVSKRQLERAVNEMEVRELRARRSLPDLLARYPRRGGTAVLRDLLADRESFLGVTESDLEEAFLGLIDRSGLPRPRINADLAIRGRFIRPDFAWPVARLVVETDGGAVHRTDRAFEEDRAKDRILIAEGWRVMRVTWRQLRDSPGEVAADVRESLRQGGVPV